MSKTTKQFDNIKEAKAYEKSELKLGKTTNFHPYKVRMSYKGKNKTFFDVTSW
jgi:hypothetical protein